ncbi:MAG: PAS domain S-box protein [Nitrospirae bacterium]|nr:PAS domain S-box protein [Nitrospirota bacterium]
MVDGEKTKEQLIAELEQLQAKVERLQRYKPLYTVDDVAIGHSNASGQVTARLKESEERYRSLFDNSPDAIFIADPTTGCIVDANKSASMLLDRPLNEIRGMHQSRLHPKDKEQYSIELFKEHVRASINGERNCPVEIDVVRANGDTIPVEVLGRIVYHNGSPFIQGVFRDIRSRRNMEDELRSAKEFSEGVINTAQAIILVLGRCGEIIRFNPYMEEVSGYKLEEVRGKDWFETFLPKGDVRHIRGIFLRAIADIQTRGNVNPIVTKDGREILIEWYDKTLKDKNNEIVGLISIGQDITERRRLEEELKNLNANLESKIAEEIANRQRQEQMLIQQSKMASMGEMIGLIAHQWKQPLNALSVSVQDLKDAYIYGELNDEYLDNLVTSSMNQILFMSKTTDTFRDFFRPSREKVKFDVKTAVEDLISMFIGIFDKSNIDIEIKDSHVSRLLAEGYPNEFKQVILNLLSNSKDAIIHGRHNGANIQGHIEIAFNKDVCGYEVIVSIRDNGGGIPEDVMDKIFDPYFTTKGTGGTGIGLYMSRTIIETNMAGRLTARNVDGGAEFIVTLKQCS